jgi:hypothetical protein
VRSTFEAADTFVLHNKQVAHSSRASTPPGGDMFRPCPCTGYSVACRTELSMYRSMGFPVPAIHMRRYWRIRRRRPMWVGDRTRARPDFPVRLRAYRHWDAA